MKLSPLSYALIALVLAATAGLFMLLRPEDPSTIFYFNMGLTLLLEGALFASGFVAVGKSRFTVQGIAIARQIARYAIFMFIAMGVFAIVGVTQENIRWYYASLVIITVIFSVLTVVTVQGASVQAQAQNRQTAQTDYRHELGDSLSRCLSTFSSVANISAIAESAATRKSLRSAAEKALFIKAKAFSTKYDAISKLETAIAELSRSIDDMAETDDPHSIKAQCCTITEKAAAIGRMIDRINHN